MTFTYEQCKAEFDKAKLSGDVNKEALIALWYGRLAEIVAEQLRRAEKLERKKLLHGVNVGDVFRVYVNNIPLLFEVLELKGKRKGVVRHIYARKLNDSYVGGECVPVRGAFCDQPQEVHFSGSVHAQFADNRVRCKVQFSAFGYRYLGCVATICESDKPMRWAA